MNVRKRLATGAAAVTLLSGLAAVPAVAASARPSSDAGVTTAASCTGWKSAQVANNAAGMKYKECHRTYKGKRQSSGAIYLWDNKHDGMEACGKITIGKWRHDWCWGNESKHSPMYISGWHNGSDAKFGLFRA